LQLAGTSGPTSEPHIIEAPASLGGGGIVVVPASLGGGVVVVVPASVPPPPLGAHAPVVGRQTLTCAPATLDTTAHARPPPHAPALSHGAPQYESPPVCTQLPPAQSLSVTHATQLPPLVASSPVAPVAPVPASSPAADAVPWREPPVESPLLPPHAATLAIETANGSKRKVEEKARRSIVGSIP
jgi:hypothetical protein